MCIADLRDYPEASRLQLMREVHDFLSAPAPTRALPSLSCAPDAGADPPDCIVRTRHGIPRVPTNHERILIWRIRYARVPIELTLEHHA